MSLLQTEVNGERGCAKWFKLFYEISIAWFVWLNWSAKILLCFYLMTVITQEEKWMIVTTWILTDDKFKAGCVMVSN